MRRLFNQEDYNVLCKELNEIPGLFCLTKEHIGQPGIYDFDETKLTVNVAGLGMTGFEVYNTLCEEYGIQLELADVYNILAIVSLGDEDGYFLERLVKAFRDLSQRVYGKKEAIKTVSIPLKNPSLAMLPKDAYYSQKEMVPIDATIGRTIGESIMVYPPGIPILSPGEVVTQDIVDYLKMLKAQDSHFTDLHDPS